MHYYQFNIGDYASHTQGLSLMEDLAYRRLLDHYYMNERPFNGCSTDVARTIGMRDFVDEVDYVLNKFFLQNDSGDWFNKRADAEILAFRKKVVSASAAGKASAARRLNSRSTDVQQSFNGRLTDVEPTINQEPINNKKITSEPEPSRFDEFWQAYAKKTGKQNAIKVWKRLRPDDDLIDVIVGAAQTTAQATEVKYRKDPERWLKGRHWEDEVAGEASSGGIDPRLL